MLIIEPKEKNTAIKKIANVMAKVGWVSKDSKVGYSGGGYDYVSEAQFISELRPLMVEEGLVMLPVEVKNVSVTERGDGKSYLTTGVISYMIADSENSHFVQIEMLSQGVDSLDKGAFKLDTAALKYALRQMFLVPTGDDPEATDEKGNRVSSKKTGGTTKKATKGKRGDDSDAIESAKTHVIKMFTERVAGGLEEHSDVWEALGIDASSKDSLPDDMTTLRAIYEFGNDLHNDVDYAEALDKLEKAMGKKVD